MNIEQNKHTYKVKVSILRILEKNDFNYLRTEKLTAGSRSTIKNCYAQDKKEMIAGVSLGRTGFRGGCSNRINYETIIIKYYIIRNQILDRTQELLPNEIKREPLINALKSISFQFSVLNEINPRVKKSISGNIFHTILKNIGKEDFIRNRSMVD